MRWWLYLMLMSLGVTALAEPARVVMSDGAQLEGDVEIMGGRPLIIVQEKDPDVKFTYQRKFKLSDLKGIVHKVETQEMNRPWMYKEAGKTDKVYGEGTYPFMNFITELHLVNGEVCRGHIVSLPLTFRGDGPKKIFLNRQLKGEVGQSFADMVYPGRIDFSRPGAKEESPISGRISGYGKVLQVSALDNRREIITFAKLKGDSFEFNNPLPGTYDLFVLTDSHVLFGLSGDVPDKMEGKPLDGDALAGIRKMFPLADDFFKPNERWALQARGNTAFAKLLVYGRRGDFYHQEKHSPDGGYVWHIDVWSWHLAGDEWKIDRRYIAVRRKQSGKETIRKLLEYEILAGVKPGTQVNLNREKDENAGKFIRNLD